MSGRIAHRPRYRTLQQPVQRLPHARQTFFSRHWTYRRRDVFYEKRPLGYGLSLIPIHYRLLPDIPRGA